MFHRTLKFILMDFKIDSKGFFCIKITNTNIDSVQSSLIGHGKKNFTCLLNVDDFFFYRDRIFSFILPRILVISVVYVGI